MLSKFQGAVAECKRSRNWSNLDKELIHVARETRLNCPILIIYRLRRQHRPQIDLHSQSLLLFYDRPDPCRPIIGDLRTPLLSQLGVLGRSSSTHLVVCCNPALMNKDFKSGAGE